MLAGSAGAAWFYMSKRHAASAEEEPAAHAPQARHAPTYLPLESMVVNLADPGGERFAQIGVTLDIENEKAVDQIKAFMPAIRSNVLMLVSQRTSEELLKRDGKEKLAADVVTEVAQTLGHEVPKRKAGKVKSDGSASWMASVASIEDYAKQGKGPFKAWTTDGSKAKKGDLVVLFGRGQHVGTVRSIDSNYAYTWEGNTSSGSSGSQSNGGGSYKRSRSRHGETYGYALVKD